MNKIIILILLILTYTNLMAQEEGVSIGKNSNPNKYSILDIESENQGVLFPRLTTEQRENIFSENDSEMITAIGLIVYDINLKTLMYWNGNNWLNIIEKKGESRFEEIDGVFYYVNENGDPIDLKLEEFVLKIIKNVSLNIQSFQSKSDLPPIGDKNIVYKTLDDNKFYKWENREDTINSSYVPLGLYDKSIDGDALVDYTLGNDKFADQAITNDKIVDKAIVLNKIVDKSIGREKFMDIFLTKQKFIKAAIQTQNIKDGAIANDNFVDASITAEKIKDGSITGYKIMDLGAKEGDFLVWTKNSETQTYQWQPKALEIKTWVIDSLTSTETKKALSANQGFILKTIIDANKDSIVQNNFLIQNLEQVANNSLTGAISSVINDKLTANRVLVSDNEGKIVVSQTTQTELSYLQGVDKDIKQELDTIQAKYYSKFTIGDIKQSIKTEDHDGWLVCNGTSICEEDYQKIVEAGLISAWQNMGGTANSRPDLRDHTLAMKSSQVMGSKVGSNTITLGLKNIPKHNHYPYMSNKTLSLSFGNNSKTHYHQATYNSTTTSSDSYIDNSTYQYMLLSGSVSVYNLKKGYFYNASYRYGLMFDIDASNFRFSKHSHSVTISSRNTGYSNFTHDHNVDLDHSHTVSVGDFRNGNAQTSIDIRQSTVYINQFIYIGE